MYLVPSCMSSSKHSYTRQKQHLHATHTFSSQGCPHGTFQAKSSNAQEFVSSIFWDSGTSLSITNDKTNFHGTSRSKMLPKQSMFMGNTENSGVCWMKKHVTNFESSSFVHPRCQGQVVKCQQSSGCLPRRNCNFSSLTSNHDRSAWQPQPKANQHYKESNQ